MPLPQTREYTSSDYWGLPDGQRAELIDGELYDMTPPSRVHQELVSGLTHALRDYVISHDGPCRVYPAPFAVNVDAADRNWVEPDVVVVCDPAKLSDRGCEGAPDLVVEVVSPSTRRMDYMVKLPIYGNAGVREYWIVDPDAQHTTVYRFGEDGPHFCAQYPFQTPVPVGIWEDLLVDMGSLL